MRISTQSTLVFVFLVGYVLPAHAGDADDVMPCALANGDASIAACTRRIQTNTQTGSNLAMIYYDRGAGYVNKDSPTTTDYNNAIVDFTAAIRLQPDLGAAFYARGKTYEALGDHARSADDLAKAAILNK